MAKITKEFKTTAREFSVVENGNSFLCIVGHHVNGSYIAILNWGVSAELSAFGDAEYNTERIYNAFKANSNCNSLTENTAREIAEAVNEYTIAPKQSPKEYFRSIMGIGSESND